MSRNANGHDHGPHATVATSTTTRLHVERRRPTGRCATRGCAAARRGPPGGRGRRRAARPCRARRGGSRAPSCVRSCGQRTPPTHYTSTSDGGRTSCERSWCPGGRVGGGAARTSADGPLGRGEPAARTPPARRTGGAAGAVVRAVRHLRDVDARRAQPDGRARRAGGPARDLPARGSRPRTAGGPGLLPPSGAAAVGRDVAAGARARRAPPGGRPGGAARCAPAEPHGRVELDGVGPARQPGRAPGHGGGPGGRRRAVHVVARSPGRPGRARRRRRLRVGGAGRARAPAAAAVASARRRSCPTSAGWRTRSSSAPRRRSTCGGTRSCPRSSSRRTGPATTCAPRTGATSPPWTPPCAPGRPPPPDPAPPADERRHGRAAAPSCGIRARRAGRARFRRAGRSIRARPSCRARIIQIARRVVGGRAGERVSDRAGERVSG